MDALPANRSWQPSCSHGTYQHEAITSRSRQLLMMGTWLSETCWVTNRREIKNTKVTSSWFSYPHWIMMHRQPHIRFLYLYCSFNFYHLMRPYASLCVSVGSNLNVHAKPENLRLLWDITGIYILLLKVSYFQYPHCCWEACGNKTYTRHETGWSERLSQPCLDRPTM